MRRATALVLLVAYFGAVTTSAVVAGGKNHSRPRGFWTAYYVHRYFPQQSWRHALQVAECESHFNSSEVDGPPYYAAGVWQWIRSNDGRVLAWGRRRVRIDWSRAREIAYSTRVTSFWTHGGRDWGEWSCG